MSDLTHLDEHGAARMVDVGGKADTARRATAGAEIRMSAETLAKIMDGGIAKGDVIATARIAGIMAAKRTHELIPLCHPLALTHVAVQLAPLPDAPGLAITAEAATTGKTGVEMEALTAASVAALTVYDMIKAVEPGAVIGAVRLISKTGGKSDVGAPAPAAPTPPPAPPLVSRGFRNAPARGKPVDMIRPAAAAAQGSRADHFRRYLAQSGAQVTQWARQAGLPAALVYSFLHGRVGRLPRDAEEKLAAAAGVSVAALFGEG